MLCENEAWWVRHHHHHTGGEIVRLPRRPPSLRPIHLPLPSIYASAERKTTEKSKS